MERNDTKQDFFEKINSYLSFKLGDETFAANVGKVLNILEMTDITKVPKAPDYMKGVINLRGRVLPVVDTRIKFNMPATEYTNNTCILVMEVEVEGEQVQVGGLVDAVQAVIEIDQEDILPPPSIGSKYRSEFISGIATIDDKFIMLLNMDRVFSSDEIINLKEKTESSKLQKEVISEKVKEKA